MTYPSEGVTYADSLQPGLNPLAIRKALITDLLIRDYHNTDGTIHNLADPSVGIADNGYFSPFAADGNLRGDLLINSAGPNLGFYHIGSLDEGGLKMGYDTKVANTMIAQSTRAVRFDVTEDNDIVTIKAVEGNPVVDALRFDLPLSNLQDLGQAGYGIQKPTTTPLVERQVICLGFDGDNFFAQTYPRMALQARGDSDWNKDKPDTTEVHLGALLDPYVGRPVLFNRDGSSWRALQGSPVFAAAPVAAAITGAEATITFAPPSFLSAPASVTYTVQQSSNGGTSWSAATIAGTAGTDNVVITVSGLTVSTSYTFKVTATGTNALSTTSAVSNSVTAHA